MSYYITGCIIGLALSTHRNVTSRRFWAAALPLSAITTLAIHTL